MLPKASRFYSSYVDTMVQNSHCFAFDHYVLGLKKLIRALVRSGDIGSIELTPISASHINDRPLALILGETNRVASRYRMIESLLKIQPQTRSEMRSTDYVQDLMRPFSQAPWLQRYKAEKNVFAKVERVYKLAAWSARNGSLMTGADAYIRGTQHRESLADYPIAVKLDEENTLNSYVQLDGSHRRCAAIFTGNNEIQAITVELPNLFEYIERHDSPYFSNHKSTFVNLVSKIDLKVNLD